MTEKRVEMTDDLFEMAMKATSEQKISGGFSLTRDAKFPVLPTFTEQKVIIYFPHTNVEQVQVEGAPEGTFRSKYAYLPSVRHQVRDGMYKSAHRCIRDLEVEPLGWDKECPICDATSKAWDLYNHLVDEEAKRLGIPNPKDDPAGQLKAFKQKVGTERDVDPREAFVTGTVVLIICDEKGIPTGEVQPYFLDFRLKRWNDKVMKATAQFETEDGAADNPLGIFFYFDFNYDTNGKQAESRDAARNMTVTAIQSAKKLEQLTPLVQVAEEAASEFTLRKANEMLYALEFKHKSDIQELASKAIRKTEQTLAVIEQQKQLMSGGAVPSIGGVAPNPALGAPQGGQPALAGYAQPVQSGQPVPQGVPTAVPQVGQQAPVTPVQNGVPTPPAQNVAPQPTVPTAPPAGTNPTPPTGVTVPPTVQQ